MLLMYCCCLVIKSCPTLLQLHELWLARLICPWDFPGKDTEVGCHFLLQGHLPDPGIKPASSALAGGFFTTESPGKLTMNFKRLNMRNFIYLWSKWQIFQEKIIDICQALEWASWLFSLWEDLQFPPRQRSTYPSAQEEKKKGNKSLTCVIVDA